MCAPSRTRLRTPQRLRPSERAGVVSRDDGFAVMDVSADIVNDPKWRLLAKYAPDRVAPAFMVYVATMGASWKAGRRVTVANSWPAVLPFDTLTEDALKHVGLIDGTGMVSLKTWREWFGTANKRRKVSRDRWSRANEHRRSRTDDRDDTALLPRGTHAVTATSVRPSVPPVRPTEAKRDDYPVENGAGPRLVKPLGGTA